jgi:membrane protein DedA with SNARE-associated domain
MNSPDNNLLPHKRRKKIVPLAAAFLAVLITVSLLLLREQIAQLGVYGYWGVLLVSLLGNATVIFPAPSFAIVFVVGGTLHPLGVGIAAGVGAAIGEMTGYLAGVGGRAVFEDRQLYQRLAGWMQEHGMLAVFILAVIPNPVFDVGGMVAGALKMPAWKFLLAAALGKSVRFYILALSGRLLLGTT